MENEPRLCNKCGKEATFYVVTNWYDRIYDEEGICISAKKKSETQTVCSVGLMEVLTQYESAHHMTWKVDDVYFPAGCNYDRLLRESVGYCAIYRDVSEAEFMWGKRLLPRLVGWLKALKR